ncbi:MATE efflux family protein [Metschnikowia bicuspidata var. bicuspidata NRRL YB-4993]|uniref:MATE efflux family protein n=1 Tax=Metschnikowia bicuspidata var. bicuspidata NRRL YB-4993 TaxID=869754 RepID=A0A1A0HK08_9ASCO|nr:MATE efflux family protein [Metschnikowia bicuspidata var. bicuspidata NRRL YB-4993]OBA24143.1 MATE efflux family protein [Metschnikowia bicuspidata var. bicuspidata NRRL YB-4993]
MVLSQVINQLANPNTASSRRRRLYIPPSTNYPLFSYGGADDQRSFLSLDESGLVVTSPADDSDGASVSSARSLPSTLSSAHPSEDHALFHSWLLQEHLRRYSGVDSGGDNSDTGGSSSVCSGGSGGPAAAGGKPGARRGPRGDVARVRTTFAVEGRTIARYAAPLIVTFVLEHLFSIVSLLVVGHLGTDELAAVSLALMTLTISLAVFEGIATALDTLCPHAYGAGNHELVSVHVQRCVALSLVAYVPCAALWWHSDALLQHVIANDEVLRLTTQFLRILVAGGPPYIFFENAKRFLQAQGIFEAGTGVLFVCAPIHVFLSWYLVWNGRHGMGFAGAPVATVLNFWLMALLLVLYVAFVDGSRCWFGLCAPRRLFLNWGQVARLAVPGVVMLESEYVAYEIMTLLALYFGTAELAAQSAVASVASLTYMVPFAVSIAALTRIAHFVGAQNLYSCQVATKTGLLAGLAAAVLNCVVLYTFRRSIAGLFTDDAAVTELIVSLFSPLVPLLQICDGVASVASGILRAQGLQKIGGVINFVAYYAFAMPLAFVLTKATDLRLEGLWIGIGSGMFIIGVIETWVILTCDWDAVLHKAGLMNELAASDDDD